MVKLHWDPAPEGMRWNKLKSLRKKKNLTQPEVAVGADVAITTIYFLEAGFEERTGEDVKKKLAEFFRVDIDDLFPCEMIGNTPREKFLANLKKGTGRLSE